jgi:hypothetical protein
MVGPAPVGVVFFRPTLAWDHSAPNASLLDAGFEVVEATGLRPADPGVEAGCWVAGRDTEEK